MAGPTQVKTLIIGAGISGLATAAFLPHRDVLVLEAEKEPGGYCRTVKKDGFVWDYSGHFFHFKHADIDAWLRQRMPGQNLRTVQKRSFIAFQDVLVDFTPAAIDWIADRGYQPEFGARPMRRAIQQDVDNTLSNMLLAGELPAGSTATVDAEDGDLTVTVASPAPVDH